MKIAWLAIAAFALAVAGARSEAQTGGGRTLEELKAEVMARAERNAYPLIGLKPAEVREALDRLTSLDRDEWAAAWGTLGGRHMSNKNYLQAWPYSPFPPPPAP